MAFLKVFSGDDERTVFLGSDSLLLGRGTDTDVLVKDLKASRHHCVIEPCGDGRWQVRDLGSGNGTAVNGKKIKERRLRPDDVITIGDARILFAGEAVAVVRAPAEESDEPAERGRRSKRRKSYGAYIVMASVLLVAFAVLLYLWERGGDTPRYGAAEKSAYRAVKNAQGDADLVELARTYMDRYPESARAGEIERLAADARERLRTGNSAKAVGYDPAEEVKDLKTRVAIERLEAMLDNAKPEHRPAIRALLNDYRGRLGGERDAFFADLERVFDAYVQKGEFTRAREIWFFLRGDEDWVPIPPAYINRIVTKNRELETSAAASRTRLFEEITRAESAHDFKNAYKLLVDSLPRFTGTSVERSLKERQQFLERALREGVSGKPTAPPTVVRVDVEKKMEAALAGLAKRDFEATAKALQTLAKEVANERGHEEVDARAGECAAAATLHAVLATELGAGRVPKKRIAKKWRVVSGGPTGLTVSAGGKELTYSWAEAPADLYVGLAALHAQKSPLGFCVLAFVVGGERALASGLELGVKEQDREVNAFVAARVKKEQLPEGGYVAHQGEVIARKEFHRRQEEALIKRFTTQFEKAHAAILADTTIKRLDKLRSAKDELDKAREYAKELIYDEKKYFYPYRGSGRMGEYNKVQQEVDRRVAAVEELWENATPKSIKATSEIQRALKQFDEAAKELEKRLVYVEEQVEQVTFLRSYFGKKFTIRTFYRTPEERELLEYGVEVMAYNIGVEGDITSVEREQVRVTNEYRIMFGHQPVRLVEKLVESSRGHCEEMSRLGYFGHFSPTPGRRTPYDRMRLAGYTYGSSENCIMGQTSPMGAHKGWCHSSGHHRNLLMAAWTEMGTGHYGRYMTQNFGRAPKYREGDKDEEPAGDGMQDPGADGDGDPDDGFDYDDEE